MRTKHFPQSSFCMHNNTQKAKCAKKHNIHLANCGKKHNHKAVSNPTINCQNDKLYNFTTITQTTNYADMLK